MAIPVIKKSDRLSMRRYLLKIGVNVTRGPVQNVIHEIGPIGGYDRCNTTHLGLTGHICMPVVRMYHVFYTYF
jgi:hypothetical protein